jgi:hypothetical protein
MKRHIALAAFAALVLATPLGAQTPQPASTQPATAAAAATAAATPSDQKTATGCVTAGADGRTFTFTESVTPTSPATDRDPSVAAPAIPATSWILVARSDIDLTKYVGKKIELTGTPDAKGGMSGNNSESATRSSNATAGPRFHVKSVKVLAETCS